MSEEQQNTQSNRTGDDGTRAPRDDVRCPKCSAGTLRPSRKRGGDWMKALIGLKPYRCSRCNQRVYRR